MPPAPESPTTTSPQNPGGPGSTHPPSPFATAFFGPMVLTSLVSNIGSWMQGFSEQWVVVVLAGAEAPLWAGRMGFATGLSMLVLTPLTGALGDHFDRRRLLALSQAWLALLALALGLLARTPGGLTLPLLVSFALATGAGLALSGPTLHSLMGDMLPPEQLAAGSGYMSAQFNLSRILGPSLAALTMALVGVAGNFMLNALSFLGVILVALRLPRPVVHPQAAESASYRRVLEACRVRPELRRALVVSIVTGFFAWSYHSFLAVYATRYLHLKAGGTASLMAAFGTGALLGALVVSRDKGQDVWGRLLAAFGGYGLGLLLLALAPYPWVVPPVLFAMGLGQATFSSLLSAVIQRQAPPELRGRINGLYFMAILGLTPLGNLVAGEVAQALGFQGVRWVFGTQALVLLATALALCILRRSEEPGR